jgi:hypothetical protein
VFKTISPIACSLVLLLGLDGKVFAWPSSVTVTSGEGDQVTYKRGLLGNKRTLVQDRLGDKIEAKRGLFGITKDSEVGILGNGAKFHKGLLGSSDMDAYTMLGDSVKYHKNILGWRKTSVNLHGVSSLIDQIAGRPSPTESGASSFSPLHSGVPAEQPSLSADQSGQQPPTLSRLEPGPEANAPLNPKEADNQDVLPLK